MTPTLITVLLDTTDCPPRELRLRFLLALRAGILRAHERGAIASEIVEELWRAWPSEDQRQ
jgi:hypothetical protein